MNSAATSSIRLPSVQRFCIPHWGVNGRNKTPAITRCNSRSCSREVISAGGFSGRDELLVAEFVGFEGFIMDFVKRGYSIVPLEQRGRVADQFEGMGVHLPYGVEHRMIVRV